MGKLEKTIEVGEGRSVTFRASALLPQAYRKLFNRDFFKDLEKLADLEEISSQVEKAAGEEESDSYAAAYKDIPLTTDDYNMFMRIAFCMAYQGEVRGLNPEASKRFMEKYPDMWAWLDSFETFSMFQILPQILELWGLNAETQVKAKNAHPAPPER